jgi:hypothetical protein
MMARSRIGLLSAVLVLGLAGLRAAEPDLCVHIEVKGGDPEAQLVLGYFRREVKMDRRGNVLEYGTKFTPLAAGEFKVLNVGPRRVISLRARAVPVDDSTRRPFICVGTAGGVSGEKICVYLDGWGPYEVTLPAVAPVLPTADDLKGLTPHTGLAKFASLSDKLYRLPGHLPALYRAEKGKIVPTPEGGKLTPIELRVGLTVAGGKARPAVECVEACFDGKSPWREPGTSISLAHLLEKGLATGVSPAAVLGGRVKLTLQPILQAGERPYFRQPAPLAVPPERLNAGVVEFAAPSEPLPREVALALPAGLEKWSRKAAVDLDCGAEGAWVRVPAELSGGVLKLTPAAADGWERAPTRARVDLGPAAEAAEQPAPGLFESPSALPVTVRGWELKTPEGGLPKESVLRLTVGGVPVLLKPTGRGLLPLPAGKGWKDVAGGSLVACLPGRPPLRIEDASLPALDVNGVAAPTDPRPVLIVVNDHREFASAGGPEADNRIRVAQANVVRALVKDREGVRVETAARVGPGKGDWAAEIGDFRGAAPFPAARYGGPAEGLNPALLRLIERPGAKGQAARVLIVAVTPYSSKDAPTAALRAAVHGIEAWVAVRTVVVGVPAYVTAKELAKRYVEPVVVRTGAGDRLDEQAAQAAAAATAGLSEEGSR